MTTAKLFLWQDGALYRGPIADTALHRHHAAQICIGPNDAPFRLQLEGDPWIETTFAFLPSDTPHCFESPNPQSIIVLIDGEGPLGQCTKAPILENPGISIQSPTSLQEAKNATNNIAKHLGVDHGHPRDVRLLRALDHIQSLDIKAITVEELASIAALSESRFQHLFSEQIGIPIRRYLLWRRLHDSISAIKAGTDLTAAAHLGGFSDSAHFSRTFKETFGLSPSSLFKNSRNVQVIIE